MRKSIFAILIILSGTSFAGSSSLKPGLWELKPISEIVDGRDMTSQIAAAQARMQQAMANAPPTQRKQMQAMMGPGGRNRICVSPAMAARDKPIVDPYGHCKPAKLSRSGNTTRFEFSCSTANGGTRVGKGESTVSGDTVTIRTDQTTTDARGHHTMQSELQMKYLGSNCQGIEPADQITRKAQDSAH